MGTKLNKILGAVLVAQLAIFGAAILLGGSSEPETQKPRQLLPDLDKKTVTRVAIGEGEGKQAVLEKKAGRWVLHSGGDFPAKQDKVDELLGKLAAVTAGAPVAEKATYHRTLEVADNKFQRKIEIERSKGDKLTFYLGSSPALKKVHFRLAGEDPGALPRPGDPRRATRRPRPPRLPARPPLPLPGPLPPRPDPRRDEPLLRLLHQRPGVLHGSVPARTCSCRPTSLDSSLRVRSGDQYRTSCRCPRAALRVFRR